MSKETEAKERLLKRAEDAIYESQIQIEFYESKLALDTISEQQRKALTQQIKTIEAQIAFNREFIKYATT
jgi:hypothetical protein